MKSGAIQGMRFQCTDIVEVWSDRFSGPRPGIVIRDWNAGVLTVNLHLDGASDTDLLTVFRKREHGNTLAHVPIFHREPGDFVDVSQGIELPFGRFLVIDNREFCP